MDLRALILALFAALAGTAFAQIEAVRKFATTNRLTEDLRVPDTHSLLIEFGGVFGIGGAFVGTPTGGNLNLSNLTLILPSNSVTSSVINNGTILDADISASAAISLGKLSVNPTLRSTHTGTQLLSTISDAGTLAGLNAVGSAQITDGSVANADLAGSIAAIKLIGTDITTVGTIANGTWQGSIIAPAYLGTGSSIGTKFLRGDGTWQAVSGGGGDVTLAGDNAFTGTNTFGGVETPLTVTTDTVSDYTGTFIFNAGGFDLRSLNSDTGADVRINATTDGIALIFGDGTDNPVNTEELGLALTLLNDKVTIGPKSGNGNYGVLEVRGGRDDSNTSMGGRLRIYEGPTAGNDYVELRAGFGMSSNHTIYLPPSTGTSGQFVIVTSGGGTSTALEFTTNGASLTSLNASNISSGTLAVARGGTGLTSLGSNVATFLGTPSFSNLNTALTGDDVAGLAAHQTFTGDNNFIRSVGTCVTITQNSTEGGGDTALLVGAMSETFAGSALRVQTADSFVDVTREYITMGVGGSTLSLEAVGIHVANTLTIGQESEGTGQIQLNGITSGAVTIKPADAAGDYVLTLPTNDGDANQFLQTNGSGVLTFASALTSAAIDTSAEVAAIVGDETGSGALVFGTSPTLTTPNLGTPSALTLTNATGLPSSGITMNTARLLGRTTGSAGAAEEITVGSGLSLSGGALTAIGGGAGTKTIATFTPLQNQPPAANFATIDTRNSIAVLNFDASTDESAIFVGVIPEAAVLTSGIKVRLFVAMASATSGAVDFGAQFERTGTDLDSDSFDTATEAHVTVSGTSGIETVIEITCTNLDSLIAGDAYRLKLYRDADDGTNDTATGDAQLVRVELRTAN